MNIFVAVLAKLAALSIPAKATALGIAVALGATGGVVAQARVGQPEPEAGTVVTDPIGEAPEAAAFGQSVAENARNGGVIGPETAAQARLRAEIRHGEVVPDPSDADRVREQARLQDQTHLLTQDQIRLQDQDQIRLLTQDQAQLLTQDQAQLQIHTPGSADPQRAQRAVGRP